MTVKMKGENRKGIRTCKKGCMAIRVDRIDFVCNQCDDHVQLCLPSRGEARHRERPCPLETCGNLKREGKGRVLRWRDMG